MQWQVGTIFYRGLRGSVGAEKDSSRHLSLQTARIKHTEKKVLKKRHPKCRPLWCLTELYWFRLIIHLLHCPLSALSICGSHVLTLRYTGTQTHNLEEKEPPNCSQTWGCPLAHWWQAEPVTVQSLDREHDLSAKSSMAVVHSLGWQLVICSFGCSVVVHSFVWRLGFHTLGWRIVFQFRQKTGLPQFGLEARYS